MHYRAERGHFLLANWYRRSLSTAQAKVAVTCFQLLVSWSRPVFKRPLLPFFAIYPSICCQQLWEPFSYQLCTFATCFCFPKHCMTSSLRHPSNLFYCLRIPSTANAPKRHSFLASEQRDIKACSTSTILIIHRFGGVSVT
jgi:hypothetical protein